MKKSSEVTISEEELSNDVIDLSKECAKLDNGAVVSTGVNHSHYSSNRENVNLLSASPVELVRHQHMSSPKNLYENSNGFINSLTRNVGQIAPLTRIENHSDVYSSYQTYVNRTNKPIMVDDLNEIDDEETPVPTSGAHYSNAQLLSTTTAAAALHLRGQPMSRFNNELEYHSGAAAAIVTTAAALLTEPMMANKTLKNCINYNNLVQNSANRLYSSPKLDMKKSELMSRASSSCSPSSCSSPSAAKQLANNTMLSSVSGEPYRNSPKTTESSGTTATSNTTPLKTFQNCNYTKMAPAPSTSINKTNNSNGVHVHVGGNVSLLDNYDNNNTLNGRIKSKSPDDKARFYSNNISSAQTQTNNKQLISKDENISLMTGIAMAPAKIPRTTPTSPHSVEAATVKSTSNDDFTSKLPPVPKRNAKNSAYGYKLNGSVGNISQSPKNLSTNGSSLQQQQATLPPPPPPPLPPHSYSTTPTGTFVAQQMPYAASNLMSSASATNATQTQTMSAYSNGSLNSAKKTSNGHNSSASTSPNFLYYQKL
jgi:hypothetical protein